MLNVGWRRVELERGQPCVRCKVKTTKGVVALHDYEAPPRRVMCMGCYSFVIGTEMPKEPDA